MRFFLARQILINFYIDKVIQQVYNFNDEKTNFEKCKRKI